jgi:hypothetical protein
MELLIEFGYIVLVALYCACIFVIIHAFYMRCYSCLVQVIEFGYVVLFELYCTCIFVIIHAFYMRYSRFICVLHASLFLYYTGDRVRLRRALRTVLHVHFCHYTCVVHALFTFYMRFTCVVVFVLYR